MFVQANRETHSEKMHKDCLLLLILPIPLPHPTSLPFILLILLLVPFKIIHVISIPGSWRWCPCTTVCFVGLQVCNHHVITYYPHPCVKGYTKQGCFTGPTHRDRFFFFFFNILLQFSFHMIYGLVCSNQCLKDVKTICLFKSVFERHENWLFKSVFQRHEDYLFKSVFERHENYLICSNWHLKDLKAIWFVQISVWKTWKLSGLFKYFSEKYANYLVCSSWCLKELKTKDSECLVLWNHENYLVCSSWCLKDTKTKDHECCYFVFGSPCPHHEQGGFVWQKWQLHYEPFSSSSSSFFFFSLSSFVRTNQ